MSLRFILLIRSNLPLASDVSETLILVGYWLPFNSGISSSLINTIYTLRINNINTKVMLLDVTV